MMKKQSTSLYHALVFVIVLSHQPIFAEKNHGTLANDSNRPYAEANNSTSYNLLKKQISEAESKQEELKAAIAELRTNLENVKIKEGRVKYYGALSLGAIALWSALRTYRKIPKMISGLRNDKNFLYSKEFQSLNSEARLQLLGAGGVVGSVSIFENMTQRELEYLKTQLDEVEGNLKFQKEYVNKLKEIRDNLPKNK